MKSCQNLPLCLFLFISLGFGLNRSTAQEMDSQKWIEDLDYLVEQLPKRHKNLYHTVSEVDFQAAAKQLREKIPQLSRHEIPVEFARIVAMVEDGHTELWLTQSETGFHWYPLVFSWFGDHLYVIAATEPCKDVVGNRVVRVGNVDIKSATEAIRQLISHDNAMEYLNSVPVYLAVPEILGALKLTDDTSNATFGFLNPDGEVRQVTVDAVAERGSLEWFDARTMAGNEPPLAVQNMTDHYWYKWLEDSGTLYLNYNRCANMKGKASIREFAREMFQFVDEHPVERFVLDLRHNTGGSKSLFRPIVNGISERPKINKPGSVFVLTGRRTFSAGTNAAIDMKQKTEAIFLGEPSRGRPNGYGEVRKIRLPNSQLQVDYSIRFYESIPELGDALFLPVDVAIQNTFEDFRNGYDRVLNAALRYPNHEPGSR